MPHNYAGHPRKREKPPVESTHTVRDVSSKHAAPSFDNPGRQALQRRPRHTRHNCVLRSSPCDFREDPGTILVRIRHLRCYLSVRRKIEPRRTPPYGKNYRRVRTGIFFQLKASSRMIPTRGLNRTTSNVGIKACELTLLNFSRLSYRYTVSGVNESN